jgi:putative membrane protein
MNQVAHAPDQNTLLALRRNFLASERTLMAWIRTSLSMIAFGFSVAKLFQSLSAQGLFVKGPAGNVWTAQGVGMVLVAMGTVALIAAVFDHRREMKELRDDGLEIRFSLTTAVASVLAIVGVMAFFAATVSF